jgi:hypothetical protein|tara:strand:- start:790 stop:966 length:177 start_codon:yes stop_codon:yes gene_type:complete
MAKFSGINRAYSTDKEEQTPQEKQRKLDELMKQFLEKGGKVEKVESKITKQMLERGKL